jgi:hypothetical protein
MIVGPPRRAKIRRPIVKHGRCRTVLKTGIVPFPAPGTCLPGGGREPGGATLERGFPRGICYDILMMRNNGRMHKLVKTSTYVQKYLTHDLLML